MYITELKLSLKNKSIDRKKDKLVVSSQARVGKLEQLLLLKVVEVLQTKT